MNRIEPQVYFSFIIPIDMGALVMLGYPIVYDKLLGCNVILTDKGKIGVRELDNKVELFIFAYIPWDVDVGITRKVFESYMDTVLDILKKLQEMDSDDGC